MVTDSKNDDGHRKATENIWKDVLQYILWPIVLCLFSIYVTKLYWKKNKIGNCLSKWVSKPFALHTPSLTSVNDQKVAFGIQKNHIKYFAIGKRFTQNIKWSPIKVYDRFPPQSFKW